MLKEKAIELAKEGKTAIEIIKVVGMSEATIRLWCAEVGIVLTKIWWGIPEEKEKKREEVIKLAEAGETASEISRITGVTRSTIRKWCEEEDISLTKRSK